MHHTFYRYAVLWNSPAPLPTRRSKQYGQFCHRRKKPSVWHNSGTSHIRKSHGKQSTIHWVLLHHSPVLWLEPGRTGTEVQQMDWSASQQNLSCSPAHSKRSWERDLLFVVWCLVVVVWCLLFVVWCLVVVVWCLLSSVWWLLFGVCCLVFVVCCLVFVVWCLLFAGCLTHFYW